VSKVRAIRVSGPGGSQKADATYAPIGGRCHVSLTLADGRVVSADESDFFEALRSVRRQLETDGLVVCCQGARRDVWASGMDRDMGAGLKAHVLTIGTGVAREEVVDIFDPAEPTLVGTVAEQDMQFERWRAARRT
jgi:hypothetical protein